MNNSIYGMNHSGRYQAELGDGSADEARRAERDGFFVKLLKAATAHDSAAARQIMSTFSMSQPADGERERLIRELGEVARVGDLQK